MGVGSNVEGEALQRAMAWLAGQPDPSHALIEEASQRFGLSPLQAAVLFRWFNVVTPPFGESDQ